MSDSEITVPSCFGNYPSNPQHQAEYCCNDCKFFGNCQIFTNGVKPLQVTSQGQVGGDHYRNAEITPWDVWDTWSLDQRVGAYRSNALKYLMRMGTKDEQVQEAEKALHYIQKLVEVLKNA